MVGNKDSFSFKQFTVCQDRTAMKVGTDGVLLGAWARGGERILDIGCGTGLISLMMAQRFPDSRIVGIDIDADASLQAQENAQRSPWADRISIYNVRLQDVEAPLQSPHLTSPRGGTVAENPPRGMTGGLFSSIVCNPPFFTASLSSPDEQRNVARHDSSLPLSDLFRHAKNLLSPEGELSLVLPTDRLSDARAEAAIFGLFESRLCKVKTVSSKPPKRVLVAFSRCRPDAYEESTQSLFTPDGRRTEWMQNLVSDFYLND